MNALDFLYSALSKHYESRISPIKLDENSDLVCSECERDIKNTNSNDNFVFVPKNSYGQKRYRCLSCHMLYTGNDDLLGGFVKLKSSIYVERKDVARAKKLIDLHKTKKKIEEAISQDGLKLYTEKQHEGSVTITEVFIKQGRSVFVSPETAKSVMKKIKTEPAKDVLKWLKSESLLFSKSQFSKSKKEAPIVELQIGGSWEEKKLNSMAGLGLVVTSDSIEFFAPGEHFQKLNKVDSFPYKLHPFGGSGVAQDVLKRYKNIRPLLVIETFGSCKEDFIKNLEMCEHNDEIVVCRDKDVVRIDIPAYESMRNVLKRVPKKVALEFLKDLYKFSVGALTLPEFSEKARTIEGVDSAMAMLPSDPHDVISLTGVLEKGL